MTAPRALVALLFPVLLAGSSLACGDDSGLSEDAVQLTITFSSGAAGPASNRTEGTQCDWGNSTYRVVNDRDEEVAAGQIGLGLVERNERSRLVCRATIFPQVEPSPSFTVSVAGSGPDAQGADSTWTTDETFSLDTLTVGAVMNVDEVQLG